MNPGDTGRLWGDDEHLTRIEENTGRNLQRRQGDVGSEAT